MAEGVEHLPEAEQLRAAGCDELQGFHYSRPLPAQQAQQVQQWIRAHGSAQEAGRALRLA